jgi:hypothetical protein
VEPEDGRVGAETGLNAEQWRDAVFTERRWLTVNTEPAHYPY